MLVYTVTETREDAVLENEQNGPLHIVKAGNIFPTFSPFKMRYLGHLEKGI